MLAVASTKGPVVEVGAGVFSTGTIVLSCGTSCNGVNRESWTFEQDIKWFKTLYVKHPSHQFVLYHDITKVIEMLRTIRPAVLLIDCDKVGPEGVGYPDRKRLIQELHNAVEVFVIHDTEDVAFHGPENLWDGFAHIWTFKPQDLPWTTLASNSMDLESMLGKPLR